MLTRLQDIKGGKLDEDGLGINNVEIALRRANIELRDTRDNFRDFGPVLEELASKWDTLTGVEQAYIAKSIAGVRQVNIFTVLMTQMNQALEYQEAQMNATGLAVNRYNIYLESIEAKVSIFKTELEKLYKALVSKGIIEGFVTAGTKIIRFVAKVEKASSAIKTFAKMFTLFQFAKFIASVVKVIQTIKAMKTGIELATVATQVFGITAAQAWAAATLGISLLISAIAYLVTTTREANKSLTEIADSIAEVKERVAETEEKIKNVRDLKEEYENLNEKLGSLKKGTDEYDETLKNLYSVQEQILSLLPAINGYYDEQGRFIIANTEALESEIEALERKLYLEEENARLKAKQALFRSPSESPVGYNEDNIKLGGVLTPFLELEDAINKFEDIKTKFEPTDSAYSSAELAVSDARIALDEALRDFTNIFLDLDTEAMQEVIDRLRDSAMRELTEKGNVDWGLANAYGIVRDTQDDGTTTTSFTPETQRFIETLIERLSSTIENRGKSEKNERLQREKEELRNNQLRILQEQSVSGSREFADARTSGRSQPYYTEKLGLTQLQAENYLDVGAPGSKGLMLAVEQYIPSLVKATKELYGVIDLANSLEIIPPETVDYLNRFGVQVEHLDDGTQSLKDKNDNLITSQDQLNTIIKESIQDYYYLGDAEKERVEILVDYTYQVEATKDAIAKFNEENKKVIDSANAVAEALSQQSEQGYFSVETAYKLIESNSVLADSLERTESGYRFVGDGADEATKAQLEQYVITQLSTSTNEAFVAALEMVERGEYFTAAAQLARAEATEIEANAVKGLLDVLMLLETWSTRITPSGGRGSSGSRKQEDPRIKENEKIIKQLEEQIELEEDKIDLYEDEIDRIKKIQDEYHDWIDQKKKSLQLTKEESDYFKKQQKSLKELAELRKRLAVLEFDTSEEAQAKRFELESEIAELEERIAEDAEERRFELQMQALDDLKERFDKMIEAQIEGIKSIIDTIKDGIDALRDQIKDIRDVIADLREASREGGYSESYSGSPPGLSYSPGGTGRRANNPENSQVVYMQDDDGNVWVLPVASNASITQGPWGGLTHGNWNAYDFANVTGQEIYASRGGTVKNVGHDRIYGNFIEIFDDTIGKIIKYSHLDQLPDFKINDVIEMGQVLGRVGNSGTGTGPHLDWAVLNPDGTSAKDMPFFLRVGEQLNVLLEEGLAMPFSQLEEATDWVISQLVANGDTFIEATNKVKGTAIVIEKANGEIDQAVTDMAKSFIEQGITTAEGMAEIIDATEREYIRWDEGVTSVRTALESLNYPIDMLAGNFLDFADFMKQIQKDGERHTARIPAPGIRKPGGGAQGLPGEGRGQHLVMHTGGLVGKDGEKGFAGNLRSNEVFAKLLKGEYVATETQMKDFLNNVLPKISSGYGSIIKTGAQSNISVSMPITVQGNLDETVVPDIKIIANQVIGEINKAINARGYVRPINNIIA